MLTAITDVLGEPEAYVCIWRDGELYVEPVGLLLPAIETSAPRAA